MISSLPRGCKEITRSDLYAQLNYNYTTKVMENYYGENREITDAVPPIAIMYIKNP